jgi:hypothetical protein
VQRFPIIDSKMSYILYTMVSKGCLARVWGRLHQCIGSRGQEGYLNILQKIWENGERGVLRRFGDSATTYVNNFVERDIHS